MKKRIKNGLITLFVVVSMGCASACELFEFINSSTQSASEIESVTSETLTTEEDGSGFTSQEEESTGESSAPSIETPDGDDSDEEENSEEVESGEADSEENAPPAEEDSSSDSASDSSNGKIELPEDKFH